MHLLKGNLTILSLDMQNVIRASFQVQVLGTKSYFCR